MKSLRSQATRCPHLPPPGAVTPSSSFLLLHGGCRAVVSHWQPPSDAGSPFSWPSGLSPPPFCLCPPPVPLPPSLHLLPEEVTDGPVIWFHSLDWSNTCPPPLGPRVSSLTIQGAKDKSGPSCKWDGDRERARPATHSSPAARSTQTGASKYLLQSELLKSPQL